MTSPEPTTDANLRAAIGLLSDPDEAIASMALETIVKSGQAEATLAELQDDPDENVRRRAHQLGCLIQQERLLRQFVRDFEQARLDVLTAMTDLDLLYDTSSSLPYLQKVLTTLMGRFKPRRKSIRLEDVVRFFQREGYFVPPLPWLAIEDYLIGDVLSGEGSAVPLVLAVLGQALAASRGLKLDIVIFNGFISLRQEDQICTPEHDWECRVLSLEDEVCPLNNQQMIRLYLSQLIASSIACWEAYDVHLFLEVFQRLNGLQDNPLPYPFGTPPPNDRPPSPPRPPKGIPT